MRVSRSEGLDGFQGPASSGAAGSMPLSAGIERQQRALITLLNKGGLIFILCRYLCTNKHNTHTHFGACVPARFIAAPVASATCSLWIFCPVVHHFSIFQARTHQAIIQDLQIPCHSDISRGNIKGLFLRGDKTTGFYTQILTRVPLSCPFIHNYRGAVSERESTGQEKKVDQQYCYRCLANA